MSRVKRDYEIAEAAALMRVIAYEFRDPALLTTALTHRSAYEKDAATHHGINNERLEFLGDAVLSLVTANYLYSQNSYFSEGDLSRMRAQYVCQENLAQAARGIDLGRYIKSDRAMRASGSTNSKATLCDAIEAIIGAAFIDGGLPAAERVIFTLLGTPTMKTGLIEKDAKTRLQELIQASIQNAPRYVVIDSSGPPHAPIFVVGVQINDEIVATATGENKKIAAQNAAHAALLKYSNELAKDQP